VQLSLSIARKVLHREAQVDPVLLAGLVRVALEQVEANSEVLVSVEPGRAPEWQAYFTAHLDPAEVPRVVEDPALAPGRCLVQTRLGKTELGLEVQLKEIEQGLMDLLALRPGDRDARS
jgi:flagellar assembly protein FliH